MQEKIRKEIINKNGIQYIKDLEKNLHVSKDILVQILKELEQEKLIKKIKFDDSFQEFYCFEVPE